MKVGAAVEVTVLAFPGRVFNAKLAYVGAGRSIPTRARLPVRAEIQNTGRETGCPRCSPRSASFSGDDRLMPAVPVDAIVYEGAKGARVDRPPPDSKTVVSRDITVGDTINGLVEVRKGLSVGETVVTSGTPVHRSRGPARLTTGSRSAPRPQEAASTNARHRRPPPSSSAFS